MNELRIEFGMLMCVLGQLIFLWMQ